MNITEKCLKCLQIQDWNELNLILSDEKNCLELRDDPIFSIFENNLVEEIKNIDNSKNDSASIVLARIFQLNQKNKTLVLSSSCIKKIAEYLFEKFPSEEYAKHLEGNKKANEYLINKESQIDRVIEKTILSANLDIKIGKNDRLNFSKSIFNSPPEYELYKASLKIFPDKIIYPNVALSTIINFKVNKFLDSKHQTFFLKSTLDLCVVNKETFIPELFIELDSSWHDKPKQIEKDKMKDYIFEMAGLKLIRLRKKQNKKMLEIFELYLKTMESI